MRTVSTNAHGFPSPSLFNRSKIKQKGGGPYRTKRSRGKLVEGGKSLRGKLAEGRSRRVAGAKGSHGNRKGKG